LTGKQLTPGCQHPLAQISGSGIDPSMRCREFGRERKVATDVLMPVGERIVAEAEDCLQLVAEYTCRQHMRKVEYDGVLPL